MRVALLKGARIEKVKKPLEKVGTECIVVDFPFRVLNVDAIITDTPGFGIVKGWILKNLCRSKLILRIRGNYWQEVESEGKFYKIRIFIANNILFRMCDKIIAVNYHLKKEILKNVRCSVDVVGVPIKTEQFDFVRSNSSEFNVVTITNFMYYEKIKPLLKYGSVIDDFVREVGGKWLIAGKGKYVKYFLEKIGNLKNLQYCGYVDATDFLKKGKIMVHLSEFEGLPNAVLEGMASGLPVIVNDFEPLMEIDGVIVVKNEDEMKEWLWKLYENPKLRIMLGIRNRKYIERNYNIIKIGEMLKNSISNR